MNTTDVREQGPAKVSYERPELQVLGTLAEMTEGIAQTSLDGLGPGSVGNY